MKILLVSTAFALVSCGVGDSIDEGTPNSGGATATNGAEVISLPGNEAAAAGQAPATTQNKQ